MPNNIPVVESDFIFSAIGEEMGLWAAAPCSSCLCFFAVRGLTTAARAKSDLAALFSATGLTAAISFQAFLIVGGVTRLIPLTGVTLPFMSQGGSSLLASFIIVALLLRAGDEATGREAELTGTGTMAAITDDRSHPPPPRPVRVLPAHLPTPRQPLRRALACVVACSTRQSPACSAAWHSPTV